MDSIFEILVGLAFVAVPAIFRWIGKSFEKAAGQQMPQTSLPDEFEQIFQELTDVQPEEQPEMVVYRHEEPAPVAEKPLVVEQKPLVARKLVKPVEPVKESDVRQKKEKIDPKKLVVYSEIMKPKYTE